MSLKMMNTVSPVMNMVNKSSMKSFVRPIICRMFANESVPKDLKAYWLPFTNNRYYKSHPRILDHADGAYYYTKDGKEIFDGCSGLWCVNAGHGQQKIKDAVKQTIDKLDYASCFNMGHQRPFEFAEKLLELVPNRGFGQVFFTNCGSSAVDTSLKLALAYHRANGNASKVRFIGRERGYHGVGFGGISVGGITPNRKAFAGALLPYTDHLPATHSIKDMAFSRGQPTWGEHLADSLEGLIALHDASTIAAVIVEPVAGSAGVLIPPVNYLQKLREICTKHNILLIFDEVITGFGRLGASFAGEKLNITPDLITCAKGLTNGTVPAGAVYVQGKIHDAIIAQADKEPGSSIEFFHGYTYGGHPLAMAAGLATLEVYKEQDLFNRANNLAPYLEEGIHSLKDLPNVVDIRNFGLMAAIEFAPLPGQPTARAMDIYHRCFDKGVLLRPTGSSIATAPPLISEKKHIDRVINTIRECALESFKVLG